MPRIRTVKPEFWADEKVSKLPRDARLLFLGLFNFADDAGRMRGNPMLIRAQVFPYDTDIDSESLLRALAESSLIVRYEVEGESYLWIRNFNKHQKIDKPSESVLPAPQTASRQTRSPKTPRTLAEASSTERKGKEGKGSVTALSSNGSTSPAERVFKFWQQVMHKPKALLKGKRKRAVEARLGEGYSVERLMAAVEGCARTPFNMGENDRHTPFNDLELICRDGTHVEKFEADAPKSPGPPVRRKTDEEISAEISAEYGRANGGVRESV